MPPPPLSQRLWPHGGSSDQLVKDGRLSVGLETRELQDVILRWP